MRLIELMFKEISQNHEVVHQMNDVVCLLSDLQCWDELSNDDRLALFGALVGAKQSVDHCLRVNYKCDPEKLPKRLGDVPGADALTPWNIPQAKTQESIDALDWVQVNGFGLKGGAE